MNKKALVLFPAVFAGLMLVSALTVAVIVRLKSETLPEGRTGPEAEALTARLEKAVNIEAWKNLAAVSFTFGPTGDRHFRDLKRDLIEVRFGSGRDEVIVQYNNKNWSRFKVREGGRPLQGRAARKAFEKARKKHVNDFFWLNPLAQLRAPGAIRKIIGKRSLLITYPQGGLTPGDSYLYVLDSKTGLPLYFKLWVDIIPLKGFRATFEDWVKTPEGILFSRKHETPVYAINIKNIRTFSRYPKAGSEDRFKDVSFLPK